MLVARGFGVSNIKIQCDLLKKKRNILKYFDFVLASNMHSLGLFVDP